MGNARKLLGPEMINAFCCRFDADLIDWNDREGTLFDAEVVVDQVLFAGLSTKEVVQPLKEALSNWGPDVIDEFCDITCTNWLFDDETTEWLEAIIKRMIEYAEQVDRQRTSRS